MRAGFEFKLLGPLEVSAGGYTVPIRAAKQRVVLASLLLDTGRVVTVDQLITQLWGNAVPAGARATLRTYVMRLRQALDTTAGTGPIITCAEGYRIDLSGHGLDLHHCEALIDQAKIATAEGRSDRESTRSLGGRAILAVPACARVRAFPRAAPDLPSRRTRGKRGADGPVTIVGGAICGQVVLLQRAS